MRNNREYRHPLTALPLPRRAINALTEGGIATLEDTSHWSDAALLSLRQFGPSYLTAIRALAAQSNEKDH